MKLKPIAYIKTDFGEKFGIPRQSGRVPSLLGEIVFEKEFSSPEALRGIEEFSHLWLIFDFSKNHRKGFFPTVRPPRLGGNERLGVFASRSPFRPNNLGLSCVKLEEKRPDKNGKFSLIVSGVDLLCNTPIYDIKPYIPYCDCIKDARGSYGEENKDYYLDVIDENSLLDALPSDKKQAVLDCIKQDPRPSYHLDSERIYKMRFAEYEISFKVEEKTAKIINLSK